MYPLPRLLLLSLVLVALALAHAGPPTWLENGKPKDQSVRAGSDAVFHCKTLSPHNESPLSPPSWSVDLESNITEDSSPLEKRESLYDHTCREGWYGEHCRKGCSSSCKSASCYGKYGTCTLGCFPGHAGRYCLKVPRTCHCQVTRCDTEYYNNVCVDKKCDKGYFLKECMTRYLQHENFDDSLRLDDKLIDGSSDTCVKTGGRLSFKTRNGAVYLGSTIRLIFKSDPGFDPKKLRVYRSLREGGSNKLRFKLNIRYSTKTELILVGGPIHYYSYLYFKKLPKVVCEMQVALGVEFLTNRPLVYDITDYNFKYEPPTVMDLVTDDNPQTCHDVYVDKDPKYGWRFLVQVDMLLFPSTIYIEAKRFDDCAKADDKFYLEYNITRTKSTKNRKLQSPVQISKVGTNLFEVSIEDFKDKRTHAINPPYFTFGTKDTSCIKGGKIKLCGMRLYGVLKCDKYEASYNCKECHTCKDRYCDRITGICKSSCIAGYEGIYCDIKTDDRKRRNIERETISIAKGDPKFQLSDDGTSLRIQNVSATVNMCVRCQVRNGQGTTEGKGCLTVT